jgi:hypothetical protein
MSEDRLLDELSPEAVRSDIAYIAEKIPSRLAGSERGEEMADYSRRRLEQNGAQARVDAFPALVSFPEIGDCTVTDPVRLSIPAYTLGHSVQTAQGGVAGALIDVGSAGPSDFANNNVEGKIILCNLDDSPMRHEKQRVASIKGAIGAVMINAAPADSMLLPYGSVKPAWGNPSPEINGTEMPRIPCIGISRSDGNKLREMCRSGSPVAVSLDTRVENGWRTIHNTIGEVEAAISDDFVVVGGHQDSWFGAQATDNAAGNACMLELARVFSLRRGDLRRGLVFGFWAAHETGTMAGSSYFVDRNWDRLRRHQVAYMTIGEPGCLGATTWGTRSNAELRRFHQATETRLLGRNDSSWSRATKTGDASFVGLGVPAFDGKARYAKEDIKKMGGAALGWWHHTLENTPDKIDWQSLQVHLRIYAAWLWELCTAPVLPFEFVSVADQFIERLVELKSSSIDLGLDEVIALASAFRFAAESLDGAAQKWRDKELNGASAEQAAGLLNACMKSLSRILIPIQSTLKGAYLPDPYGLAQQSRLIPGLFEVPELDRLPRDTEAFWMLETQLVRERNRVADALSDGRALIQSTLAQIQ